MTLRRLPHHAPAYRGRASCSGRRSRSSWSALGLLIALSLRLADEAHPLAAATGPATATVTEVGGAPRTGAAHRHLPRRGRRGAHRHHRAGPRPLDALMARSCRSATTRRPRRHAGAHRRGRRLGHRQRRPLRAGGGRPGAAARRRADVAAAAAAGGDCAPAPSLRLDRHPRCRSAGAAGAQLAGAGQRGGAALGAGVLGPELDRRPRAPGWRCTATRRATGWCCRCSRAPRCGPRAGCAPAHRGATCARPRSTPRPPTSGWPGRPGPTGSSRSSRRCWACCGPRPLPRSG